MAKLDNMTPEERARRRARAYKGRTEAAEVAAKSRETTAEMEARHAEHRDKVAHDARRRYGSGPD